MEGYDFTEVEIWSARFFFGKINTATVSDLYDEDEVVMQSPAMEGCMSKEVEI